VRLGRTEEGSSAGLEVRRPFKHLADPRAYGVAISQDDSEEDYYRGGESLAQVPVNRSLLLGDLTWGAGPREQRTYLGFAFAAEQDDYGAATGPLAPEIRVPGDTSSVFFGPTATWQRTTGYRKVEGLDTLDYVQDLTLGWSIGTTVGARYRDEQGAGSAVEPEFALGASLASEIVGGLFTNVGARGNVRFDDGRNVGWNASAFARAFALVTDTHTLAANCTYDAVEETQDLLRELTLGEDNGLRGYRTRLLSGTRRVRANFEDRYDTGVEFATLRLGLIAFYDAGWVGDDSGLGPAYRSFGGGVRIGSKPLLGSSVLRIDLAKPLDDSIMQSDGWKVSLTMGQVFTFGGGGAISR